MVGRLYLSSVRISGFMAGAGNTENAINFREKGLTVISSYC